MKFAAIYFAVLPFPFIWSDGYSVPMPPLFRHCGVGNNLTGALGNSPKVLPPEFSRILESSISSTVLERRKENGSYKERMGSTGQQSWRQTFVKRHLCRNSPRVGEILEGKVKPFNMLELCKLKCGLCILIPSLLN